MEYWVTHCGCEGYIYLLVQRRILKLMFGIMIISLTASISVNIFETKSYEDLIEHTTLNNKEMTFLRSWVHVGLVIFFSILTIGQIVKIRQDARKAYKFYYKQTSLIHDHEFLKSRTLHVKGLLPEDRRGDNLKNQMNQILEKHGGKVVDCLVIPDFVTLFKYEQQKSELEDLRKLVYASGPGFQCNSCLIPAYAKKEEAYDRKMRKIERKIDKELEKAYWNSGHAFVCFDSLESMNAVLNYYRVSPLKYCALSVRAIKTKFQQLFAPRRERNVSTFDKFYDIDEAKLEDQVFLLNIASEPIDIVWSNMGGNMGFFLFRRVVMNVVMIIILLFFSTPATLLSAIERVDTIGVFTLDWMKDLPFGEFLKHQVPPILILTINLFLLFLIDLMAVYENHSANSDYQKSVYLKSVIYLCLNMLVIPAITLATSQSFIDILWQRSLDINKILGNFYIANSGVFFVSILIQQACLSSAFYLNNGSEVLMSYLSPWLAVEKRKILNDSAPWKRHLQQCFQYGYFYAQIMVAFSISIVFCNTVPLVTVASCFFIFLRHFVDCFQLLTYFRKEIDSSGKIIESISNTMMFFVLVYQACMFAFF